MHVEALLAIFPRTVGDAWVAEHEESCKAESCPDDCTTEVLEVEIVDSGLPEISRIFHVKTEAIVQAAGEGSEYSQSQ